MPGIGGQDAPEYPQETKNVEDVQKMLFKLFENKEEIQALIKFLNSNKREEQS